MEPQSANSSGILTPEQIAALGLATDSNGSQLTISGITLSTVVVIVVTLRLWGRIQVLKIVGWDDYCAVAAAVLAVCLTVMNCISAEYGMGSHIWVVGTFNFQVVLKYAYFVHLVYILSLGFTRASLLLQLVRLAPTHRMRVIFWTLLGASGTFTIAAFFSHVFICKMDPSRFWLSPDPKGDAALGICIDYVLLQESVGGINIIMDFITWLSPLKIIWQVRLPRGQKISLILVFLAGGLVWIASISRLIFAVKAGEVLDDKFEVDPSYRLVSAALWTNIEVQVAVICSCLPTLRPFIRRFLPGILTDTGSSKNRRTTGLSNSGHAVARSNGGSIPLGSMASKTKMDDEYSSSTEQFATAQGTTTDIEGGCETREGQRVMGDMQIYKQTEVRVQIHRKGEEFGP